MNKVFNVGLVGCGHISETYFRAQEYFNNIKIIKCADLNNEVASKCAKNYGIEAVNLDNIFNKFYPKSQTVGTGRKLYIMAWAIEIFVAMVGLTMAYIFFQKAGTDTNSVGATSDRSDGIIVALSFV